MAIGAELRARVEAWIADDPDPVDQAELTTLLDHALGVGSFAVTDADDDSFADEVIAFCRANMAHFKAPRTVVFGPLPKTSTGKIQKYLLREYAKDLDVVED